MNENTEKLIRELADKLGTTADHLWGILIKQAFYYGISYAIFSLFFVGLSLFFAFYAKRMAKRLEVHWNNDIETRMVVSWILCAATSVITLLLTVERFPLILAAFFNPEYWALKQILP